ncbi:MAG: hypothetical protein ABW061_16655 [Polyangiaceae bacterium]
MFAQNACAPAAPRSSAPPGDSKVHLLLVRTPRLNPRGLAWLQRAQQAEFDGLQLQRLIRMEKLSLG